MLNSTNSIGKPIMIWLISKLIWNGWREIIPKWKSLIWNNRVITSLEHTCQDFKEQQVVAHIKFNREKHSFTAQIQDWKG
jgi:hypothetical protein